MGTKNDPGNYDCYTKAADDEPIFVLRAKDPFAATLVRQWADMAEADMAQPPEKIAEARKCADDMCLWRAELSDVDP